jgi:4-amino-4-deoxy-L-arabinose transferase-like glycosyltransferase
MINKTFNVKQFERPFSEKERLFERQDFIHIAILVTIALVIGVYLIATTTLIAEDGVSYINYAKGLATTPLKIIRDCSEYAPRSYTPGYPFLILIAHKLVSLFSNSSTVLSWTYPAQAVNLFFRMLSLVPLYFIGRKLVGSRLSFYALLILIILPYPARFGADVLRDWPNMFFLAIGFLLLLWAAENRKVLAFGLIGVITGLGYLVRPECMQLVFYAALWLIFNLFRHKNNRRINSKQLITCLILLTIGFLLITAPYMKIQGRVLPEKLHELLTKSFSSNSVINRQDTGSYTAIFIPSYAIKAIGKLINNLGEILMYYFLPALLIGIRYKLPPRSKSELRFFMMLFLFTNICMLIARYCLSPQLSKRYTLPLVVFFIFYASAGLQIISTLFEKKFSSFANKEEVPNGMSRYFFILLTIGIVLCIPKLLTPIRIEKKDYRLAAKWLKTNTPAGSVIAVSDPRISFYAERGTILSEGRTIPRNANYAVRIYENGTKPMYDNGAFNFNGISDYIDLGPNTLPFSGDFSISGWVYCEGDLPDDTDRYGTAFGTCAWTGHIKGIVVRLSSSDDFLRVAFGDGLSHNHLNAVSKITTTNKQKWYHIVVARKYPEFVVYVNGEFVSSIKYENDIDRTLDFQIGHSNLNPDMAYWYGSIKNVRTYDKALSISEIRDLYSGNKDSANSPIVYISDLQKRKLIIYRLPLFSLRQ